MSIPAYLFIKLKQTRIQILIILLVTTVAYLNIFPNQFVWDDYDLLSLSATASTVPQLLTSAPPKAPGIYRPVGFVFALELYTLFGTNPVGYHAVTLIIHLTAVVLIFFLFRTLTTDPVIPFLTALFFGVHPAHTESITWITSGVDMLGVVFLLTSILAFVRVGGHPRRSLLLAYTLAALAYGTLELTLILPALVVLIFLLLRKKIQARNSMTLLPFIALGLLSIIIRWRVVKVREAFGYIDHNIFLTGLTMTRAFLEYLRVLIAPIGLTVNHALGRGITSFMVEVQVTTPAAYAAIHAQSLTDPPVLLTIGILLFLGTAAVAVRKKQPLVALAIGWFLLTLSPVSNIIPTHTLFAERYLYLPSVGFCLLLALGLSRLIQSKRHPGLPIAGLMITVFLALTYSYLTLQRNREWRDSLTLWTTAVERNPSSFYAYSALAHEYSLRADTKHIIDSLEHLLTINPEDRPTIVALAQFSMREKNYSRALALIQTAIRLSPTDAGAWVKLGDVYRAMNREGDAVDAYTKALSIDPAYKIAQERLSRPAPK